MSDNHRSIREISNQYLPNKQSSQRRWVDFPNYLHPKEEISFGTNQNSEQETTVEHYLPFSKQQKSALEEKDAPQTKDGIFQSFKESSQRGNNREKWRSFLQEKPARKRFIPSTVPSILKGMTPLMPKKVEIPYKVLEERLRVDAEDLLIFSSEEIPLVMVEEIAVAQEEIKEANHKPSKIQSALGSGYIIE